MRKLKILCERGSSSYEAGLFSTAIWKQKGNIRRKPMEKQYIFKFNIRRVFHYKIAGNVASFIKPCKNSPFWSMQRMVTNFLFITIFCLIWFLGGCRVGGVREIKELTSCLQKTTQIRVKSSLSHIMALTE